MAKPDLGPIGELVYEAMGFWASQDEENDWTMAIVCDVIGQVFFEPIYDIVAEGEDGERGWSKRFDPYGTPANGLPYLAQFPGAVLTPGMTEDQAREEIAEPTGWGRGRLPSITLITKRELTGTKWVRIRPRTPGPGHIYIRTLASETPHPARVETELLDRGIPAWELLDYEAITGVHYVDAEAGWKTYEEAEAELSTYYEAEHLLPDELP